VLVFVGKAILVESIIQRHVRMVLTPFEFARSPPSTLVDGADKPIAIGVDAAL
jgi:hypothetical protein